MQLFEWFNEVVAHLCSNRQHVAPIEGHDPLPRPKDEDRDAESAKVPHRKELDLVWAVTS